VRELEYTVGSVVQWHSLMLLLSEVLAATVAAADRKSCGADDASRA
jgi:hypothetical protein